MLENDRVRMWDYTWTASAPTVERQYAHDSIEVIVTGGSIRTRTADGKETTRVVAPNDAPRAITTELK